MDSVLCGPWLIVYDVVLNLCAAKTLTYQVFQSGGSSFFLSCNSLVFIVIAYQRFWVRSNRLIRSGLHRVRDHLACDFDLLHKYCIKERGAGQFISSQEEEREIYPAVFLQISATVILV